jgi:hypothetical protein
LVQTKGSALSLYADVSIDVILKLFEACEGGSAWLLLTRSPKQRVETTKSAAQMVRSFAALVVFTLLGAAVIALPGFAPKVKASESAVLAKADRLMVLSVPVNCSKEVWPDLSLACMQRTGPGENIPEARLVTTRR